MTQSHFVVGFFSMFYVFKFFKYIYNYLACKFENKCIAKTSLIHRNCFIRNILHIIDSTC